MNAEKNKLWEKSLKELNYGQEYIQIHMDKIEQKEISLKAYEEIMRCSFKEYGIDYDAINKKFPIVLDRFKEIGKELTHRTIYKALCSQIHNDAEDFINDFWHQVTFINSNKGLIPVRGAQHFQEIENKFFSCLMVYSSVLFFLEACVMYISRFDATKSQALFQMLKDAGTLTKQLEIEKDEWLKTLQKDGFT